MENSVNIKVKVEDPLIFNTVYQTIVIEVNGTDTPRGQVSIKKTNDEIHLTIEAEDFVALRALSNSLLRLMKTSLEISSKI